ncbi:MAG: ATP-dependent acyl-CoA ligase [Desulfobacterales bacterium]|nr:ATP-dependent acyl-CoA ligase [Desulfobacterales bacterium]
MNIRELIETTAEKNSKKVFLYFADQEVTYEEFDKNINKAANVFLDLGIKKGDRVCFFLPNCPEFLYGWFGLAKIGAVLVPINTNYRTEETKYIVNHSEANSILVHSSLNEVVDKIRSETPLLKNVLFLGEDIHRRDYISFEEALGNAQTDLKPIDISEEDICEIMYTSGTTGPSKGVLMTHKYWILNGQGFKYPMDVTPDDRLFTCLPLFHANAQGYSTMGALTSEASLILTERFSASNFWDQIRHYKATVFNFIGAMLTIISKQPESEKDRDHHVRAAYGSPALDKKFQDYMEQRYGITFVSGYGLTECGLCLIQPLHGLRKEKSMGLPKQIPGAGFVSEARIVNEEDKEVPRGTVGEIVLKNPVIMKGYFKEPELTKKTIRDGWLHTGDQGWMDEDGYFYFADRKKDVIRRRGENVSSMEVENVINAHPKVLESAVIGVPSELYDDDVKAYVILRPKETLDPIEIVKWCKERLAYFKVPRYIEFRAEFPKTPTHRVQKYKLKAEKEDLTKDCFDLEKTDFKLR